MVTEVRILSAVKIVEEDNTLTATLSRADISALLKGDRVVITFSSGAVVLVPDVKVQQEKVH